MDFDDGEIDDDLDPAMKEELDRLAGHAEHHQCSIEMMNSNF